MDLIQNEDYAADSCAISPTAFLFFDQPIILLLYQGSFDRVENTTSIRTLHPMKREILLCLCRKPRFIQYMLIGVKGLLAQPQLGKYVNRKEEINTLLCFKIS